MSLPGALIVIAVLGFALYLGYALLIANRPRRRIRKRLENLKVPTTPQEAAEAALSARRIVADSSIASFDALIKRVLPRPAKLRERMAATGKRISLSEYLLSCFLVGAVTFLGLHELVHLSVPVAVLLGVAAGVFLPHWFVGGMAAKRQRKFLELFPEAIELMVRGLKSGVPVSESMRVVGREIPDPVGVEFRGITDALTLGQPFDEALALASKRISLPEFRFFVISLGIQQETGGNLAETLENLTVILRKRKQMKLKVKALSSEARASAAIIGALPFLMFIIMFLLNRDQTMILFDDPRGNLVLGMAVGSLLTGVGVMTKMGKLQV
jgi:tight adherence protein B